MISNLVWKILKDYKIIILLKKEEYGVKYYMCVMGNTIFSWIGNQLDNSTVKVKLDNRYAKGLQGLENCELQLEF